jgi:hypothetical protein
LARNLNRYKQNAINPRKERRERGMREEGGRKKREDKTG